MPLPPTHCVDLANGKFDGTNAEDLKTLFECFSNDSNKDRLVVHFHGGLVNTAAGTAIGERLLPIYEDATGYPVFFVWHSGLAETISKNLSEILKELVFRRLRDLVMQFAIGKARAQAGDRALGLELPPVRDVQGQIAAAEDGPATDVFPKDEATLRGGDGQLTESQEALVFEQLRDDAILTQEALAIASSGQTRGVGERGLAVAETRDTKMDENVVEELRGEVAEGERGLISTAALAVRAIGALKHVLARFASGRDHGLYPTVVEELLRAFYLAQGGQIAWSKMKQDTADAFGEDPSVYGGTAFLHRLRETQRDSGGRTILIGHSTGAVYICHFLRHADEILPVEQNFDVVLLAPACTFDLFDQTLTERGHRIANLRIFTMKDELERLDRLVPAAYTRSLLYFVSGVVEDEADKPIAGMERFYANAELFSEPDFESVQSVREHIEEKNGRVIWSETSGREGWSTTAHSHGDFDNNEVTLASVAYLIRNGFD